MLPPHLQNNFLNQNIPNNVYPSPSPTLAALSSALAAPLSGLAAFAPALSSALAPALSSALAPALAPALAAPSSVLGPAPAPAPAHIHQNTTPNHNLYPPHNPGYPHNPNLPMSLPPNMAPLHNSNVSQNPNHLQNPNLPLQNPFPAHMPHAPNNASHPASPFATPNTDFTFGQLQLSHNNSVINTYPNFANNSFNLGTPQNQNFYLSIPPNPTFHNPFIGPPMNIVVTPPNYNNPYTPHTPHNPNFPHFPGMPINPPAPFSPRVSHIPLNHDFLDPQSAPLPCIPNYPNNVLTFQTPTLPRDPNLSHDSSSSVDSSCSRKSSPSLDADEPDNDSCSRHIPWHPPPQFYLNSGDDPVQSTASLHSRPNNSMATTAAAPTSTSTTSSSRLSSCLYELSSSSDRAPPASSAPQYSSLDLAQDLSSIFSQAQQPFYSSGVTGATPPLSNLSFVTTTAPSTTSTTTATPGIMAETTTAGSEGRPSTGADAQQSQGESSTDPEIPEGVDPSFLAALPEHIRQEVISEQLRLQRIRRRAQEQAQQSASATETSGEGNTTMEINPEFLAALPPAIQEEVLAQQRAEQARIMAQQQSAANPDLPVDPASFFSTLSTSLRQQVLSDMDDSMLAVLPPELAAEAQELRRDMEERHRRLLQERLFAQAGAASISAILRHSGLAGRLGTRYAIRATQRQHNQWSFGGSRLNPGPSGATNPTKVKGRFMLDPEALTCLLVLLFIDEPKLNTTRLHRVLRNLCYHGPTRAWLIRALLSIVQRAGDNNVATSGLNCLCVEGTPSSSYKDKGKGKKSAASAAATAPTSSTTSFSSSATSFDAPVSMQSDSSLAAASALPQSLLNPPQGIGAAATSSAGAGSSGYWLSISLDAALGCRANVFQIHRTSGKKFSSSVPASVSIHPQAAPIVCRHALDTLISLAKIFPTHFLPAGKVKEVNKCDASGKEEDADSSGLRKTPGGPAAGNTQLSIAQSSPKSSKPMDATHSGAASARHESKPENDFWNILVRLDSASGKSKGKGVQRSHSTAASESELLATDYNSSALGQLMSMLNHPVVRRSQLLTDRLLRLLGLISVSLPDNTRPSSVITTTSTAVSTAATTTAASATTAVTTVTATTTTTSTAATAAPAVAASTATTTPQPSQGSAQVSESSSVEMKKKEEPATQEPEAEEDDNPILYEQLKLAVEVLTSKSCSEEGLEDATNLLLQLSWANAATRAAVLELLLSGARQLGMTVCSHINSLLQQLKELNTRLGVDQMEEESSGEASGGSNVAGASGAAQAVRGTLPDRFAGGASIVVSAPSKLKTGRELQLPSMSQLTSKTSGQQFFLRILKVIIQLRDAARSAGTKNKKLPGRGRSGFEQIHAILNSVVSDDEFLNLFGDNQMLHEAPAASQANTALGQSASLTTNQSSIPEPRSGSQSQASSHANQDEASGGSETPMEVDSQAASAAEKGESSKVSEAASSSSQASGPPALPRLSEQLGLEELWATLGDCLAELARTPDHHAVLILQPAVEAFFIVHAGEKGNKPSEQPTPRREDQLAHLNMEMAPPSPSPGPSSAEGPLTLVTRENSGIAMSTITHLPPDTQKFLKFAETHRTVLNQILRQSTLPLAEGPFSVLVDYTRILDFDVKRRYFRQELERMNEGARREDLPVHVRRSNVFEDSFRELFRRTPEEWKQRFYIVFEGEEGQDAGGLLREWYIIISHEIFNQNYALFLTSPGDRVTYSINPSSHCNSNHLSYFKFVGRIIAKAVYDNKLLDCYFTRSFYKHMLGLAVKYMDMESEDYAFYQGLVFLLENNVADLGYDIYFSTEIQEFGVTETRELIPNGANVIVTDENKREYVKLVCQMKMTGAIRQQLNAFLEGFYDIIPKKLVSIFTEQELELLISGLPTIDIDDLKANTEYHKYQSTSLQIQWFWRALRSFDQAERANFLQFVTGTSKVPLGGFGNLEGMNGTQKFQIHRDDRSTDRLPSAHTCFNQLDLPAYETYDKLRKMLLLAISECSEGFGLA